MSGISGVETSLPFEWNISKNENIKISSSDHGIRAILTRKNSQEDIPLSRCSFGVIGGISGEDVINKIHQVGVKKIEAQILSGDGDPVSIGFFRASSTGKINRKQSVKYQAKAKRAFVRGLAHLESSDHIEAASEIRRSLDSIDIAVKKADEEVTGELILEKSIISKNYFKTFTKQEVRNYLVQDEHVDKFFEDLAMYEDEEEEFMEYLKEHVDDVINEPHIVLLSAILLEIEGKQKEAMERFLELSEDQISNDYCIQKAYQIAHFQKKFHDCEISKQQVVEVRKFFELYLEKIRKKCKLEKNIPCCIIYYKDEKEIADWLFFNLYKDLKFIFFAPEMPFYNPVPGRNPEDVFNEMVDSYRAFFLVCTPRFRVRSEKNTKFKDIITSVRNWRCRDGNEDSLYHICINGCREEDLPRYFEGIAPITISQIGQGNEFHYYHQILYLLYHLGSQSPEIARVKQRKFLEKIKKVLRSDEPSKIRLEWLEKKRAKGQRPALAPKLDSQFNYSMGSQDQTLA